MKISFAITQRSYSVKIKQDRFIDLLDSESHVTNHAAYESGYFTLCDKLSILPGVDGVEYSGHFGSYVFLTICDENDTPDLKTKIADTITEHLEWCKSLQKTVS